MKNSGFDGRTTPRQISYAYADTDFGLITVAYTAKGICAVLFGLSREQLLEDLISRFPDTTLMLDQSGSRDSVNRVVASINSPESDVNHHVFDRRGTTFQNQVWQALGRIKAGTTVSYTQLAADIGKPTAFRAVATACAANPIAVLVPCHRVVRGDGSLSGYRWGLARKRALLDQEAKVSQGLKTAS